MRTIFITALLSTTALACLPAQMSPVVTSALAETGTPLMYEADQSKLDPTLSESQREVLSSTVGFAPAGPQGTLEWIVDDDAPVGSFDDFKGRVLVLQSFDTSSARSRSALRKIYRLLAGFDQADVRVLGVHTPVRPENAPRLIKSGKVGPPVLVDHTGEWCDEMGIHKTPTTIIIDRNGVVRHAGIASRHVRDAVKALSDEPANESVTAAALPLRDKRFDEAAPTKKPKSVYPPFNTNLRGSRDVQGKKAPKIEVAKWIVGGAPQTKGKVVVVEFWAKIGRAHV